MPSYNFRLSVEKPTPYPKRPATLGEHLLKKRLENGLFQKDVAKRVRVAISTIIGWEKGRSTPEFKYYPAIFAFLGYDPFPKPKTLGQKIVSWRRRNGVTRKALAKQLGIDEATLEKREKDTAVPKGIMALPWGGVYRKYAHQRQCYAPLAHQY
ncbi:helix-turn-helix domain-containing protein [Kordiimonas pumila]|uniref:helix-turn-helix domain-containing protein n=1 Tax=Kordiimonas pumila TaxID=2161677 RepID=UPI001883417F|nr:helix-turn-helix transcriptional regulator [Kordiimonas pumila]